VRYNSCGTRKMKKRILVFSFTNCCEMIFFFHLYIFLERIILTLSRRMLAAEIDVISTAVVSGPDMRQLNYKQNYRCEPAKMDTPGVLSLYAYQFLLRKLIYMHRETNTNPIFLRPYFEITVLSCFINF